MKYARIFVMLCFIHVISWWRHQMEAFSALLAICAGNSPASVNSPHKGQWRGALMFSLICAGTNGWANNQDAGHLRRHRAHYDVTVMFYPYSSGIASSVSGQFYDCPHISTLTQNTNVIRVNDSLIVNNQQTDTRSKIEWCSIANLYQYILWYIFCWS